MIIQPLILNVVLQVPMLTLSGHKEGISAVEWTDTTEVCTASWDHTVRLWDLQTAKEKSQLVKL